MYYSQEESQSDRTDSDQRMTAARRHRRKIQGLKEMGRRIKQLVDDIRQGRKNGENGEK